MPRVYGDALGSARMRQLADDFQVDEVLGFEPDGDGEHRLLHLRKRDTNTHWLAGQLARHAGVPIRDVSYAGLKDRHAVTTQWFSIRLAGRPEPDWSDLNSDLLQVLAVHRHRRKLRRGQLRGNRFQILLRDLHADRDALSERLRGLQRDGMPNYFGEQRFGHDYANIHHFEQLLGAGRGRRIERHRRGMLISAVRSQLFNEVLAARIERQCWSSPLPGDFFMLDGSRAGFADDSEDGRLAERCQALDIHPSGPLWGRGSPPVTGETAQLEQTLLAPFDNWRERLEHLGLAHERRSLRLRLDDLRGAFEEGGERLRLSFSLPAGAYATVLLRELLDVSSPDPA